VVCDHEVYWLSKLGGGGWHVPSMDTPDTGSGPEDEREEVMWHRIGERGVHRHKETHQAMSGMNPPCRASTSKTCENECVSSGTAGANISGHSTSVSGALGVL
jgi:hypothetical protein